MHWPKVSNLKKKEMENLKEMAENRRALEIRHSLNTSSASHILRGNINSNRSDSGGGLRGRTDYLSTSNPTITNIQDRKRDSKSSYSVSKIPKRKWKANNMIPKPVAKKPPVVVDYLHDMRMKRAQLEEEGRYRKVRTPFAALKNPSTGRNSKKRNHLLSHSTADGYGMSEGNLTTLDPVQGKMDNFSKIGEIREKARMIERKATRKEQLMKFQEGSIEANADVNEMLIDAISAKLQILDNL